MVRNIDNSGSNPMLKRVGRQKKDIGTKKREKKSRTFRISARNLMLTYAKCNLSMEYLFQALMRRLLDYKVKDYLFVKEKHEDGSDHYHVLLSCEKKVDRKGSAFLDVEITNENGEKVVFHGNYERCKSETDAISYLTKDIFKQEEANERMKISEGYSSRLGEIFQYLSLDQRMINLAEQDRIPEAISLLKVEDPKRYLEQGSRIEKRLKELVLESIGCESEYPFDSYILPPGLEQAIALFEKSIDLGESKVLVVQGPPGCGKTSMLKALIRQKLKKPRILVISNIEALSLWNNESYDAILIDDADFSSDKREKLIQILDYQATLMKVRYKCVNIAENTPKAISTNIPVELMSVHFRDKALKRRIIECEIEKDYSLYNRERTATLTKSEKEKEKQEFYVELERYQQAKPRISSD